MLIVLLPFCFIHLEAGNYKHWLNEEVTWIISQAEREAFKSLQDDDSRADFVREFWNRRDPTPSTVRNEYKEAHYRRLLYVNEVFREGMPGWRTDRGRVYILHGPPDSESFFRSRSTISPLREVQHTERNPNTIVWIYHQLPNLEYYRGEIRLVFQPSTGLGRQSFALSESRTAQERASELSRKFFPAADPNFLEADIRYKLVMAGPPSLVNASGAELPASGGAEMATYIEEILRSPGELLEQYQREKERRELARAELSDSVKTHVSFAEVPFELTVDRFYRIGGDWLVPLKVQIPIEQLGEERVDLYAALYDKGGRLFDELIDSLSFSRDYVQQSGSNSIYYYNAFSAPSGEYLLKVIFRELISRKAGYRESKVKLSEFGATKVEIASILLTNRVEVLPAQPEDEAPVGDDSKDIIYNQARLLPNPAQNFLQEDYLFLYLQLWVPEPKHQISVNANFIREGEIVKRLEPRFVEGSDHTCLEYGTAIPLEDFEPGDYIVQIQALDHTERAFDIRRADFAVLGPIIESSGSDDAEPER